MGSLSKFFAEHLDLFTEAFDLDEESNLVEKDHTSAEIVEKLVHDIFVTEMQDILSEFVMPQRRRIVPDDDTGYHHFRVDPAMVNPPMMVTPDLDQMMAQRQAQGGQGQAQTGGQVPARAQAPQAGQAQAPVAGQGGSIPTQIVSILKGRGWSDAAIRGALANAMAEGGLSKTWQQSGAMSNGQRENSFGPWQFNARGELPGYMAYAKQNNIANPQGDIGAITNYMASRVEKMMPNYVKHTDDKTAVDDFHINFERPADKTPGSRYQHLGAANQYFTSAQQQLQQAQQTPQVTGGGQFNLGNRAGNVNQTLLRSVQAGAGYLPAGYQVNVTSGERPGAHVHGGGGPSQHSGGNAIDMQIVGPNGQIISNRGEDTTGMYGRLARASYHELLKSNPDLAGKMAWGGNFTTSANGGDKDLMHIDLGGDRGRYGSLVKQYQQNASQDNFNTPRTPQTQQQATQATQGGGKPNYLAIGDSLAVGMGKNFGNQQYALGSQNPAQVNALVQQAIKNGDVSGKHIVLSGGASNAAGDVNSVNTYYPQMINALKQAGASNVTVMGVGPYQNYNKYGYNDAIGKIAQNTGSNFTGPLANIAPFRGSDVQAQVHPADYRPIVNHINQNFGNTQFAQNKPTTPATQPTTAPTQTTQDNQPSILSKIASAAQSIVSPKPTLAPSSASAPKQEPSLAQQAQAIASPKSTTPTPATPPAGGGTTPVTSTTNQSQPLASSANPYLRKRLGVRLLRS